MRITKTCLLLAALYCFQVHAINIDQKSDKQLYVCPPCYHVDNIFKAEHHKSGGTCQVCGMKLIEFNDLSQHDIAIHEGSGNFLMKRKAISEDAYIQVFYYLPQNLTSASNILLVLPGAGRNAGDYRDAMIKKAEEFNLLILSISYPESHYPRFWNYNIARMIKDVKINEAKTDIESYQIETESKQWIFNDFDEVFLKVKNKLNMDTEQYDLFGHSAGGQLLHRFAMFGQSQYANRIISANSGWYTLPSMENKFPYGSKGINSKPNERFKKHLVVFLGELDNEKEKRGQLARNKRVDKQGLHRLERGKYFFNVAVKEANTNGYQFNWSIKTIPNVGHDHQMMGNAAAAYLYSESITDKK